MGCILYQKLRFIFRIRKYLLYTIVFTCSCLLVIAYLMKIDLIDFFKPWNALIGVVVFFGLELFIEFNRFAFMIFNP